MDYDKYNEYLQERWEGMVDLIEQKKLNDYALGRAMIKFSKSKNPIHQKLQKHGYKKAYKHVSNLQEKNRTRFDFIVEEVGAMILNDAKDNFIEGDSKQSAGSTTLIAKIKPYDTSSLKENIDKYLKRCVEKKHIHSYNCDFSKDKITVNIKLYK